MDSHHQLDFDFSSPAGDALPEMQKDLKERGYQFFKSEQEQAVDKFNKKFGMMIGHVVRLKLFGWDEEFTGRLVLNTLLLPESRKDEVPLRINRITFDMRDIEYCIRI